MEYNIKNTIYNNIFKNTKDNKIYLTQKDFANGTYRITSSGYYILKEDIIFNPGSPSLHFRNGLLDDDYESVVNDWLPSKEQLENEYNHSSFILGFYSAINVETDNVIIDLNGFTIKQHPLHNLQQRFFQIIQLNNSPFIKGQGPSGTFSNSGFIPTNNIVIKNGKFGTSSHYAIHGNDNTNVVLEDLVCENFESGGIALNNIENLVIDNVYIKDSRRNVPILASYSVLRNTKIIYNKCREILKKVNFNNESGLDIFKKLLVLERRIISNYITSEYKSILNKNIDDDLEKEIEKYYYNKSGLSDGSVLTGIQITPKGIAIHSFEKNDSCNPCCNFSNIQIDEQNKYSSNIYINGLTIENLIAKPVEIVTCKYKDKQILGSFGDIFNILGSLDIEGYYRSNILNNCLCCLSKILKIKKDVISTLNTPEWMTKWSESGKKIGHFKKNMEIIYGMDIMGHTNKGCLGIRIGGVNNINLRNININNIHNIGDDTLKSKIENKNVTTVKTNVEEETGTSYGGILSIGIIFSNCSNIKGENINISDITSKHNKSFNILYNDSEHINKRNSDF